MSTFEYSIIVYSPDGSKAIDLKVLVDTGSTVTWIPRSILEKLVYKPVARKQFELEDGSVIDRDVTSALIRIDGEIDYTRVAFSEPGELPSLGAVTMEQFFLTPDPVRKKMIPVKGLRVPKSAAPLISSERKFFHPFGTTFAYEGRI